MGYGGFGGYGYDGCCPSYGYPVTSGCGYSFPSGGFCGAGTSFTIVVVLFILLIIIGASFCF